MHNIFFYNKDLQDAETRGKANWSQAQQTPKKLNKFLLKLFIFTKTFVDTQNYAQVYTHKTSMTTMKLFAMCSKLNKLENDDNDD